MPELWEMCEMFAKRKKAYAVILRTDDEPEVVAERISSLGYDTVQIDHIDETPLQKPSEVVWQA